MTVDSKEPEKVKRTERITLYRVTGKAKKQPFLKGIQINLVWGLGLAVRADETIFNSGISILILFVEIYIVLK